MNEKSNPIIVDENNIDRIKIDIYQARQWALDYFNAHQKEDDALSPPTFDVEFPEPDTMTVWPRLYGRRLRPGTSYRLAWKTKGAMVWVGENPLTGAKFVLIVA